MTLFFPTTTYSKNVENFRNSFKVEVCRKNDFSFSLISKRIYPVVFAVQSLINFIGDILYEQNHFTLELSTVQHRTPLMFLTFSKSLSHACQLYYLFYMSGIARGMSSNRFENIFCQTAATASVISFFSESSQIGN